MGNLVSTNTFDEHQHILTGWLGRLTVADGLFFLILIAAAALRFVDLGQLPLSPTEASEAWATWQLWQPGSSPISISTPAYFSLTGLLTQVLGYSDAAMRLVPAVFGLGTVLLPWFLRDRLGNVGTLVYTLLLAISPLNGVIARTAGGDAIAMFAIMLTVVAWLRFQDTADSHWRKAFFGALGLGLVTSPLFYSGLVTLVFARIVQSFLGPSWSDPNEEVSSTQLIERKSVVFGSILLLALSTMFLWYPAGLAAAAALPAKWLGSFNFQGDLESLLSPLFAIGRYEILLIVPGIAAIIWASIRNKPLGTFCVYWTAAVIILALLQRGQMHNALLVTLPGYLLLARFADDLLTPKRDMVAWALAGGIILMGMLIFVNIARYSRLMIYDPQQLANVFISFIAIAIVFTSIYFVGTWHVTAAYQGTFLGILALILFYTWGTSWWLGHAAANDPRERWVTMGTDDDIRLLHKATRGISRQVTGSDFEVDIYSAVDSPVLHWYFRDFIRMQTGDTFPANTQSAIIISEFQTNIMPGSDYLGADFGLIRDGQQSPETPSLNPVLDTLRWWIFHESANDINEKRVVLWWRSDLLQGQN